MNERKVPRHGCATPFVNMGIIRPGFRKIPGEKQYSDRTRVNKLLENVPHTGMVAGNRVHYRS